jgi:hypothetical protein
LGSGDAVNKGTRSSHWIARKSTNGGNSWATTDDYQLVADCASQARCVCKNANGNMFVAGQGNAGQEDHWVVRKSIGATGPWITVDVFQNGHSANAIAADPFANVFVGGNAGGHWLIKKY